VETEDNNGMLYERIEGEMRRPDFQVGLINESDTSAEF
jgi:hypothetical protein